MARTAPAGNTRQSTSRSLLGFIPSSLSKLAREARWILFASLAAYLTLVVATYHATDPGWSHSVVTDRVLNSGGRFGAWVADLTLYLFGFSVWWWVILLLQRVYAGYQRLADQLSKTNTDALPRVRWEQAIGFFLLLLGSMGLEATHLTGFLLRHSIGLPNGAGGLIGQALWKTSSIGLGQAGGTLLLVALFAMGTSLFFGFSWLVISERIGGALEWVVVRVRNAVAAREDRKVGEVAVQKRAVDVVAKQEVLAHEPVRIEPSVTVVPVAPKVERMGKEKQRPLFQDTGDSRLPPLDLLDPADREQATIPPETLEYTSRLIEKKLADFGVSVSVVAAQAGPVITRYEVEPAVGVKGSQVVGLAKDLARALSLVSIRVVETIPGKNLMGLELPNPRRQTVRLSEILGSDVYHSSASMLTMALGKDIAGKPVVADLAKMPHLLVAGTTGSGKSVGINAMILSLLYKADAKQVRLIMIDPKMLEMSVYEGIPHLLAPVVTDMRQAANALNWCVGEMEKRYRLMSKLGVRNLAGYNAKIIEGIKKEEPIKNPFSLTPDEPEPLTELPMVVVVIDELADLMMVVGKKIEELIARLAQKARAAGIHLILATQRPSVDVITGLIKANIPTRIAFQVSSKIDSRTILDQMGAEALLGQGDMLYMPPGTGLPARVHGAFVSDEEVHRVVEQLKAQGEPDYIDGILDGAGEGDSGEGLNAVTGVADAEADPMYDQAVEIVLKNRRASISLVQRHLRIGYNRAARLLEQMEQSGLVSSMQSNGNREIIAPKHEEA
jgi:S-DNA-T family DNA segregation ATPase FtsK/SpoIIIE